MSKADRRARKKRNYEQAREERYSSWRRYRRRRWVIRGIVIVLLVVLVAAGAAALFGEDDDSDVATDETTTTEAGATSTTVPPPEMAIDESKIYRATIETSKGTIVADLDPTLAPQTVNSFVVLARDGYFDGIVFHRVVDKFVIQAGDPSCREGADLTVCPSDPESGPGYTLPDELPEDGYAIGDLAMANAGPNTGGSQWFVVTGETGPQILGETKAYSKFGTVVEGLDVAVAIEDLEEPGTQQPTEQVVITRITIEER